jgi:branched-subunit amino acid aminotransferase/4-amino-4-deoxychorismate lyase
VLDGITMQLLERQLPARGVPSRRIPVNTSALRSFRAAFVTNARGIAPVGQIDDLSLPVDGTLLATLTEACESAGWDPL